MEEHSAIDRRRRGKGSIYDGRKQALERIKAHRFGGRRSEGVQIRLEEPIYDTVTEDEYKVLVAKRQAQDPGFIVDDEGNGFGDQGEEEDWSQACGPPSSDESETELEKRKKKRPNTDKKEIPPEKPSQRISSMFTSSVIRKPKDGKVKILSCDSIVDDVIAEFAPDETDRERRRKVHKNSPLSGIAISSLACSVAASEDECLVRKCDLVPITLEKNKVPVEVTENREEFGTEVVRENVIEEKVNNDIQTDPVEKKIQGFTLNAKLREEKNQMPSAGWQAGIRVLNGSYESNLPVPNSDLVSNSDGQLSFYIIDAQQDSYGANTGNIFLFGKVKEGNTYKSCCVVIKNMQRCVYAIPDSSIFTQNSIMELERQAEESKISTADFHAKLHEMASGLKRDLAKELLDRNVSGFCMKPVKRNYAFERLDIPHGENYVIKLTYPFKDPPLPQDLKGETFRALLGTHTSALEHFLIKRKIKGPSWLSISKFVPCQSQVSWCKTEIVVDCPKDIHVLSSPKNIEEIPPLVATAITLKTAISKKHGNEIVSASVICCHEAKIDSPVPPLEWKTRGKLSHFTVVRKLDGGIFPMGFMKEVSDMNSKAGSEVIIAKHSERALLSCLMDELIRLDTDVLVGHNISGFDLDVLVRRVKALIRGNTWSKIGRLRLSIMPNLTKGSTNFGSGASAGIMSCIAGRVLCDTYLCSKDLLKEVSYSLTQLAKTQLNKDRKEIAPHDVPKMFESSESLMGLIECGEMDAWLSMELMFHLSVLPLTRQLTNISGNLWGKTLQGARAQRVELFLLHTFHAKKFIVPDKFSSFRVKEPKVTKRKMNRGNGVKGIDELENTDAVFVNDSADAEKIKKGPSYLGGLVLEPKKGLYDKYILLLDFNSLYPSIIQEYNICFTTVEKSTDELIPYLPSSRKTGVLPELLKNLVERRRAVKSWMKTATGLKYQQLDIQQQALKLTANSMYGCLGFSSSRFYAKPLAELITLQGREILQSTVNLVQNNLGLEVIYGDTDSVMVYTGLDDISKAKQIAGKVIQEVNKKYKCLEIDLDGLYKRMLLLKKKKYAAVKVQYRDGTPYEVIERKGLDMVRRDWSLLSKDIGDYCLSQILSGGSCEEVVESIHATLVKVQEEMRNGQIALEKYVIVKTLTKAPEAYTDAKNQPHVQVALRLKENGYVIGCSVGDTVPYIICCEGIDSSSSSGIAQRARHPDELTKGNVTWMIDIDYYLAQQIHPVVSRLCASIEGTSPARLADCLGLDSSKFQSKSTEAFVNELGRSLLFGLDAADERYRGCEPLFILCPNCSGTFNCPTMISSISSSINEKSTDMQDVVSTSNFWCKLRCPKCPEENESARLSPALIANQVKRQAEGFISRYYNGMMTCEDETCKYTTRSLNMRVLGDCERGTVCPNYPRCNGCLVRQYTERDLYRQLSYFCYILDTVPCTEKVKGNSKIAAEKEARIKCVVELAAKTVQKIKDRCSYGWVKLNDLTVTI
ncbi:hypothetical protein OROGR_016711 [Orobanche gracilis]